MTSHRETLQAASMSVLLLLVLLAGLSAYSSEKSEGSAPTELSGAAREEFLKSLQGRIVFQSDRDGDNEIYVMKADGSQVVQLTDNQADDRYPAWSPDGEKIAFTSDREGNYEIYTMTPDGKNLTNLTRHPGEDGDPSWSPDGKKIIFYSDRSQNGWQLYTMDADGSRVTQLTNFSGRNILPAWSPDGTRIAFVANRILDLGFKQIPTGWNLYLTDPTGKVPKQLTWWKGGCEPSWSPDGEKMAWVSFREVKWVPWVNEKSNVWVMNSDGSDWINLTADPDHYNYFPEWSPDGTKLAYAKSPDKDDWALYILSVDEKTQVRMTDYSAKVKFPDWR